MKKLNNRLQLVYLDTSIFAGAILLQDEEDKKSKILLRNISKNKYTKFEFVTSKFTLIELAELISRKKTENKAKVTLFDLLYYPNNIINFINPEKPHKKSTTKEYFDMDTLISNIVNTALKFKIPGFDTIHAHTVSKQDKKTVAISKDNHFKRFNKIKKVIEILKPSQFLEKYK